MESWTVPATPAAEIFREARVGFFDDFISEFSPSFAAWKGPAPFSDSLELPGGPESLFCWNDSLDHCISYLNKELGALGLPALYKDDCPRADTEHGFSLLALVNSTCGLLKLYQGVSAKLGDMEAQEIRRAGELDYLRTRHAKLKDQVEACQREIAAVQNKEQQLQSSNKQLKNLLGGEKEEVSRLLNTVTSRAAQHLHEMKRKEQELNRLKDRMSQLVTEKKDKRGTIEILNALPRPDGKRSTWKTGKSFSKKEEELFRTQLARQEQRERGLVEENSKMKQLLTQVGQDLQQLMGETERDVPQGSQAHFSCEVFQEQWCQFRDSMDTHARQAVGTSSGSHAVQGDEQDPVISVTDHDKEIMKLKEEIEQSKALISLQQHCFQEQLAASINMDPPAHLKGSYFLEEQLRLQEEREVFEEQKQTFEVERKNFTEAAIRLGWEKKQFEDEKAFFLKQEFLCSLPGLEVQDPKRRFSVPVASREHDHLHRRRSRSKHICTPYPKTVISPSHTPMALFRNQLWHHTSNLCTPARAELSMQKACLPTSGSVCSPLFSQRKEDRRDTACQTEATVRNDFSHDLLDYSMDSSFQRCQLHHVIGIQEHL